jgi:hypothetical protein
MKDWLLEKLDFSSLRTMFHGWAKSSGMGWLANIGDLLQNLFGGKGDKDSKDAKTEENVETDNSEDKSADAPAADGDTPAPDGKAPEEISPHIDKQEYTILNMLGTFEDAVKMEMPGGFHEFRYTLTKQLEEGKLNLSGEFMEKAAGLAAKMPDVDVSDPDAVKNIFKKATEAKGLENQAAGVVAAMHKIGEKRNPEFFNPTAAPGASP